MTVQLFHSYHGLWAVGFRSLRLEYYFPEGQNLIGLLKWRTEKGCSRTMDCSRDVGQVEKGFCCLLWFLVLKNIWRTMLKLTSGSRLWKNKNKIYILYTTRKNIFTYLGNLSSLSRPLFLGFLRRFSSSLKFWFWEQVICLCYLFPYQPSQSRVDLVENRSLTSSLVFLHREHVNSLCHSPGYSLRQPSSPHLLIK